MDEEKKICSTNSSEAGEGNSKKMSGFHESDAPILCVNGCGFFGTTATMNLCSKCYRDSNCVIAIEEPAPDLSVGSSSSEVMEKKANRCGNCYKKVGVTGFKCRCGTTFCGSHRYPEEHGCTFDFKGEGKDAIAKANPLVKADKMDKL